MRVFGWLLLGWLGTASADFYQTVLAARWSLETSKLSCRLTQTLPHLGQVVFEQEAGEALTFFLQLDDGTRPVEASVQVRPAPWQHQVMPGRLHPAVLSREQTEARIGVRGEVAEQMLAALFAGRFPAFIYRRPWGGVLSESEVAVSAVRIWEVYDDFQKCRRQLPPYGLKDFQSLRYFFREHQTVLPRDLLTMLDRIADYLQRLGHGQVVVRNATAPVAGVAGQRWFRKRYAEIRRHLQTAGLDPAQVVTQASKAKPRIEIVLFGPEGLRLYHYGRRQRHLTEEQRRRLRLLTRYVNEFFRGRLIINGYSDGARWRSERVNLALSRRWAERIRDFLVAQGVAPERMEIRAWGSRHRVASNLTRAGQAKNRRVLIEFDETPLLTAGTSGKTFQ